MNPIEFYKMLRIQSPFFFYLLMLLFIACLIGVIYEWRVEQ